MNERIRQLSEQAWSHVLVCDDRYSKTTTQLYDEKFAELIIRECAKVAAREQALNAEHMDVQPRPQVNISQSVLAEFGFSQITTTPTKEQQLVDLCKQFIADNNIHCTETIYQTDRVIENAYGLIEQICNIVGYKQTEEDE